MADRFAGLQPPVTEGGVKDEEEEVSSTERFNLYPAQGQEQEPIDEEDSQEGPEGLPEEGLNAATMEADPRYLAPPPALQGKTSKRPCSEAEANVERIASWVVSNNQRIHVKHLRWDLDRANGQARKLERERAVQMALGMKAESLPRQPVKILVVQGPSMTFCIPCKLHATRVCHV